MSLLLASSARAYNPTESSFSQGSMGVRVHAPEGWVMHQRSGFPSLLAVMVAPRDRATITIALGELAPGRDLAHFVRQSCGAMRAAGMRVSVCGNAGPQERYPTVSHSRDGWRRVEQLHLLRNGQVMVFSLASAFRDFEPYSRILLRVFDSVTLEDVSEQTPEYNVIRGKRSNATTGAEPGSAPPSPGAPSAPAGGETPNGPLPGGELEEGELPEGELESSELPER